MGEGAVAQGAVHESLNLAGLWSLPCLYVIENNHWGMGTAANRALCMEPIGENLSKAYGFRSYELDGMDFFNCYAGFKHALEYVAKTSRPVVIEAITDRFRGHSISDPAVYRSKEDLQKTMARDPINILKNALIEHRMLTEDEFKEMDRHAREVMIAAMQFAEDSPWPDVTTLEEGVFAPEDN